MIPNTHAGYEVKSNITDQAIRMSFDEHSLAHIMSVLTDLYSDPELAIIREYSTNARDAHIEAGKSDVPIEVYVPTRLSPFFKVKDHGVGLSASDLEHIYSKYGASTKRDTNDQVGFLGLGCKSALAYCSQFTLTSVKDGHYVQAVIARDSEGSGSITVVYDEERDLPNGTEIIIPVKIGNQLQSKAEKFFRFWPAGSVLINGRASVPFAGEKLTENIYYFNDPYSYDDLIVMGGVSYPCKLGLSLNMKYSTVAFVEIGDVHVTPSREALFMSKHTKATIARIQDEFAKAQKSIIETDISNAASRPEALVSFLKWKETFTDLPTNITYKGESFPQHIKFDAYAQLSRSGYGGSSKAEYISLDFIPSTLFVTNFQPQKAQKNHRDKVAGWLRKENRDVSYVRTIFLSDANVPDLVSPNKVVDWNDAKTIKLERKKSVSYHGNAKEKTGSYQAIVRGKYEEELLASEIDTTKPLLWTELKCNQHYRLALAAILPADVTLIFLPLNRQAKFLRTFKASQLSIEKLFKDFTKSLSADEIRRMANKNASRNYRWSVISEHLDPKEIDDPDVRAALEQPNPANLAMANRFRDFGHYIHLPVVKDPLVNYPLVTDRAVRDFPVHVYAYMNLMYRSKK